MALIAERLATITLVGGVGRFALGRKAPVPRTHTSDDGSDAAADAPDRTATITVTAVPIDDEPDLPGGPLTVDDLREVFGTSLFVAAGEGCVAFAHQSYAEFLTASYLSRRAVTGRRLASVLGADVNGIAPGPMIEVLGWLLALGADVPNNVVGDNAKALLSTIGFELANEHVRENVVQALLRGAARGTVNEGWRLDTSILSHPRLGTQLHAATRRASNFWEIFWITRIARHCVVIEVADDLLEIARSASWPAFIRAEAVRSFAAVAPIDRMPELESLLGLDEKADPHDDVLAATLRALLPASIDVERVTAALRPRRSTSFGGDYSKLLDQVPTLIRQSDVLAVLRTVLARQSDTRDRDFGRMRVGLLAQVWATSDPDAIRELGGLLGHNKSSRWEGRWSEDPLPWEVDDNPELRRTMAEAMLLSGGDHSWLTTLDLRVLTTNDAIWLIEWIAQAPVGALEPAMSLLRQLAWAITDAADADYILDVDKQHPAYPVLSKLHGSVELDARPEWIRDEVEDKQGSSTKGQVLGPLRDAIATAQGDLTTWWTIVVALSGGNVVGYGESLVTWDLTARPLWSELGRAEQEEFWRLSLEYARTRKPEPARWVGRKQWAVDEIMPDWTAVFALATAAVQRPELLGALPASVWETWAPVIVAMPAFSTDNERWQPHLQERAPEAAREPIAVAMRQAVRSGHVTSFADHPLADFSDPKMLDALVDVAQDVLRTHEHRDEALALLVLHAPARALTAARAAQDQQDAPAGFARALATLSPNEYVASRMVARTLAPLTALPQIKIERLSDDNLTGLADLLLDEVPFADDPATADDLTETTPRADARRLRFHVLQAMAARGMADALESLGSGRPGADIQQIHYHLRQAREREALRRWRPLEPSTIMKLLARGDARIVRDDSDLAAVLLEQIELIQRDLHERASFRILWDREPGKEGASPKVEDDISDWLTQQLQLRLASHVVVDREIQVSRPNRGGIGTRIDITATSTTGGHIGRIPFEAKRVENPELLTAIDDQLVNRYMEPTGITRGIYIVYWVDPAVRPPSWHKRHDEVAALSDMLQEQADRHRPGKHIDVVVLDIGPRV